MAEHDWTVEDARAENPRRFNSWTEPAHRDFRLCPACHVDLTVVGVTDIAYTFERCDCGTPDFEHLVEQLWHRECFRQWPSASGEGDRG